MASEVNLVIFQFLSILGLKVPDLYLILLCLKWLPWANLSTRLAPRCLKVGRKKPNIPKRIQNFRADFTFLPHFYVCVRFRRVGQLAPGRRRITL